MRFLLTLWVWPLAFSAIAAQNGFDAKPDEQLQQVLTASVNEAVMKSESKNVKPDELAVTLIDLRTPNAPRHASLGGDVQFYPASVVKLFYLVAVQDWLAEGKFEETSEVRRALRDMIVDSGNEATHYLVDLLTETTSGPELSAKDLESWYFKRNAVNRFFAGLGYQNINVNRKPWCEGPYGRENQSIKAHTPNHRNWLTTDATARLLTEIARGRMVSTERSAEMMKLLARDPFPDSQRRDSQGTDFIGAALSRGDKLWSKAGWTSETRHDAAYIELPQGARFVLVIFTKNHSNERDLIPALAKPIIERLRRG